MTPGADRLAAQVAARLTAVPGAGVAIGVIESTGARRLAVGGAYTDGQSLDEHSVFEIASVTKTMTAALLAGMVLRGEVALDDPAQLFLPGSVRLRVRTASITLAHLATHTSGLPRLPMNVRFWWNLVRHRREPYRYYTAAQLYAFLSSWRPRRAPGEGYEYSNLGFGVLGHLLGRHAGVEYDALIRREIAEPLGMPDTRCEPASDMERRLAHGHDARGRAVPRWRNPTLAGAGAVLSTLDDMMRYLAANLDTSRDVSSDIGGVAVSSLHAALAMTHERRASAGSPQLDIGLAWHIVRAKDGRTIVWHNGRTGGYSAFIGFEPVRRTGVVVLSNAARSVDELALTVLRETE